VVSFTERPLYSCSPMNKWRGGRHFRFESFGEEKNLLPLPGVEPRVLGSPARNLLTIPTELSSLNFSRTVGS
jgi:hypothetical protein